MLSRTVALFIALLVLLVPISVHAQWLPSGATTGPIYYNGGNVGIGSSAPAWTLEVNGNIGVKGTAARIRTATDADTETLTFLGTKLILGQINSRAYGYTGSAIAYIGGFNDGIDLLRMSSQAGGGLLTVTQSSINSLKLTVVNNGATAFTVSGSDTGIGTPTPTSRLDVAGKLRAIGTSQAATLSGNGTDYYGGGRASSYSGETIYGTPEGDGSAYTYGAPNTSQTYYTGGKAGAYVRGGDAFWFAGGGAGIVAIGGNALQNAGNGGEGGAGIYARGGLNPNGTTRAYAGYFAGDVVVTGNIGAKYQDVAEWVPTTASLSAGTVVVLDTTLSNHVLPSSHSYDTKVAGVVSERPGLILGEAGDSKAMIATTGRVRVRVNATRAPIAIGDLLVTSDRPGVAMKSIPIDLQGIAIHRPGTVIGKALEPLSKGEGEILVLLSLQ